MIIIITIIVVVVVVVASIITTMIIIFQSGSPVSLGDFHRWSLPAERLDFFFPKPHVEAVLGGLGPLYSVNY